MPLDTDFEMVGIARAVFGVAILLLAAMAYGIYRVFIAFT